MSFRRLLAIAALIALSGSCWAQSAPAYSGRSLQSIDPFVERQEYVSALERLKRADADDATKRAWLWRHAEAGHVPLQYELAALLFPQDPAEGLKWYARGRLARTLDAAECATDS